MYVHIPKKNKALKIVIPIITTEGQTISQLSLYNILLVNLYFIIKKIGARTNNM